MGKKEGLIVSKIKNGTVIDHISPGQALKILKILGITGENGEQYSLVSNTTSKTYGLKDIVKIENRELTEQELNKIAIISPYATYNIIRNYEVVRKKQVEVPNTLIDILRCGNPGCITNVGTPFAAKEQDRACQRKLTIILSSEKTVSLLANTAADF